MNPDGRGSPPFVPREPFTPRRHVDVLAADLRQERTELVKGICGDDARRWMRMQR
jgi:hypothetical protein